MRYTSMYDGNINDKQKKNVRDLNVTINGEHKCNMHPNY